MVTLELPSTRAMEVRVHSLSYAVFHIFVCFARMFCNKAQVGIGLQGMNCLVYDRVADLWQQVAGDKKAFLFPATVAQTLKVF